MKYLSVFCALVAFGQFNEAFCQGGFLDASFGNGGIIQQDLGPGEQAGSSVTMQPDGKILVGGYGQPGLFTDFMLMRYLPNGTLDLSFGTDGVVYTDIIGFTENSCIVLVQEDGKIVIAGSYFSDGGTSTDIALARYTTDGVLDPTFDSDGIVLSNLPSVANTIYDGLIQADGKIILAGSGGMDSSEKDYLVLRYNTDGTLDYTFDSDGRVFVNITTVKDICYSIKQQSDGKFIMAGTTGHLSGANVTVVKINEDGSMDNTFGTGGIVTTAYGSGADYGTGIAIQSDGKYVVCGNTYNGTSFDFMLLRYNEDGSLDATFDGDGALTYDLAGLNDSWEDVHIMDDDKIVVSGYAEQVTGYDFVVGRYNADATLDMGFGTNGLVTTDIVGSMDKAYSSVIQSDGKIVLCGYADNGVDYDVVLARYYLYGTLSSETENNSETGIAISPNPTKGLVHLVYGNHEDVGRVLLTSSDGKKVMDFSTNDNQVDLSDLPAGIYYVQVFYQNTFYSTKILRN